MRNHLKRWAAITLVVYAGGSATSVNGAATAAIATAAAAGTAIAVPTIASALTHSTIKVTVEVYAETIKLGPTNDVTKAPDQNRSKPFKLGGPTAIQRSMQAAQSGALMDEQALRATAYELRQKVPELDRIAMSLRNSTKELDLIRKRFTHPEQTTNYVTLTQIHDDFTFRERMARELSNLIRQLVRSVDAMSGKSKANEKNLEEARSLVCQIRVKAEELAGRDAPAEYISLFRSQLKAAMTEGSREIGAYVGGWERDAEQTRESVAIVLYKALQLLDEARSHGGNVLWRDKSIAIQVQETEKRLAVTLQAFGYDAAEGLVGKFSSQDEVARWMNQNWEVALTKQVAQSIVDATFVGVAVGSNVGPIANEAFQGIFSKGAIIDAILEDKAKWKEFNVARSRSGAGDHNAVIYFDNLLTPILKTGSFDPSQIIAANAQLYKRAFGAFSQIYGVPTTPGSGGNAGKADLNMYNQRARALNARHAVEGDRKVLGESLGAVIVAMREVQSKTDTNGAWVGTNEVQQATTGGEASGMAKEALEKVLGSLERGQTAAGT